MSVLIHRVRLSEVEGDDERGQNTFRIDAFSFPLLLLMATHELDDIASYWWEIVRASSYVWDVLLFPSDLVRNMMWIYPGLR